MEDMASKTLAARVGEESLQPGERNVSGQIDKVSCGLFLSLLFVSLEEDMQRASDCLIKCVLTANENSCN